jgi:VCBS repeat-containing protein
VDGALANNGALRQTKSVTTNSWAQFLRILNQAGDVTKYYGVDMKSIFWSAGTTTVTISGNQACPGDGSSQAVQRCFEIDPMGPYGLLATFKFWYLESEHNGNTADSVNVSYWDGSHWVQLAGASARWDDGTNYRVEVLDTVRGSPLMLSGTTVVNSPPVATDDSATTNEDTPVTIDVLANDTDVDGDTLTVASVTQPSNGSVTNNGTNVSYTPNANYNGSDSFTYTASDGNGGSDTATVNVTVTPINDPPVAVDDAYSTDEDTTLTVAASGVLGNDTDAENDSLTAVKVGDPSHGTLTLNSDGSFTYTPDDDYNRTDSFTYKANDGAADSNTATVIITINAVNDAPVAVGDAYNTDENTPLTAAAPGVLGNDSDLDSDPLTAVKVSDPSHGTLTLNSNGSFTYTPAVNFNGTDSFTYKANDGTADSNTATVTITVNPVNDTPSATGSTQTLQADTSQAITLAGTDVETALVDLTFNVVNSPLQGTLTGTAPDLSYTPAAGFTGDDSFTFTVTDRGDPDGCTDASPACTAALTSPSATVELHVEAAVPVLTSISPAAAQVGSPDVPLSLTGSGFVSISQVQWNETTDLATTYVDAGHLTAVIPASLLTTVQTAQVTVFTPAPGGGTSNVLAFFVTEVEANVTGQDVASGTDPSVASGSTTASAEGDGLLVVAEYDANPGGIPSFSASGTYFDVYTAPDSTFSQVTIEACSLNASDKLYWWNTVSGQWEKASPQSFDAGCVTLTVTDASSPSLSQLSGTAFAAGNTAPVSVDDAYTIDEDTLLTVGAPGVLLNDSDVDGDSLSTVLVSGPTHGTLTLNADGSFTYMPNSNYNGTDSFTYQANDGELDSNVATVTITVDPVNDAPVITAISAVSQTVDYSDQITPVTITAVDVDSIPLTLTLSGLPAGLSLSDASCVADGGNGATCNWILSGQVLVQEGAYEITFTANDGLQSSNTVTHTLTVEAEEAGVTFDGVNVVSVLVHTPGVDESQPFSLTVHIEELEPDLAAYLAGAGTIGQAEVSMSLVPVGPGEPVDGVCSVLSESGSGYDAVLTVECGFDAVPVNTYSVEVTVLGGYYTGSGEDVLTVYDPSLGFTTGGGWFYWPDDGTPEGCPAGARTNFGYTMKYNKKGARVRGSLLLICHLEDGTKYRIKSNALEGLALGESDDGESFGWASFSGKATYLAPELAFWNLALGEYEAQGNYEFTVYVEDHNEPGNGIDRFWIETRDKDNVVVTALSMPEPVLDNATSIESGNIFVPHGGGN